MTITSTFSWTGGNLNTSSTAGEYRIQTPLGVMDPNGGTVSTGSTLKIMKNVASQLGSTVDMFEGVYDLLGGGGFVVGDGGTLQIKARYLPNPSKIEINDDRAFPNGDGQLTVEKGAMAIIQRGDFIPGYIASPVWFYGETPKLTNNGTVKVLGTAEVRFATKGEATGEGGGFHQVNPGNATPETVLQAGCEIKFDGKTHMWIEDGNLRLAEDSEVSGDQPAIEIEAPDADYALKLDLFCGMTRTDDPTKAVRLEVTGSVKCGGYMEFYAKKSANENDQLRVTKKVEFGGGSQVGVEWFENDNGQPRGLGQEWTLIKSTDMGNSPIEMPVGFHQPGGGVYLTPRLRENDTEFRVEHTEEE